MKNEQSVYPLGEIQISLYREEVFYSNLEPLYDLLGLALLFLVPNQ